MGTNPKQKLVNLMIYGLFVFSDTSMPEKLLMEKELKYQSKGTLT